ncbi:MULTISPECIES: enoyl-CoA hydratase/isomerase family protein [unclassified Haladaptatus]|uniref:enoyl-CoA hydratase/isomerase family protein n=1 Tax=unclassified Haladaptatus TaxID=2622732 RepID=UPI0023E8CFD9|nr:MULTISPECIES: enoyl-CoA hydratase-related protein [unclassified Haladaptatus]
MADDAVLLDIEDDVATVTLNRPDVRNALTHDVAGGIIDALDEIEESDARCLVIQGTGGAFCAGGDINAMMKGLNGEYSLAEREQLIVQRTSRAVKHVAQFHLPTIAKIDGVAFGAGANLAIACDILLATEDSKISFGFRQVGLTVDSGTSYLLPRIVGQNTAQELVLTGELVDADRAEDLGLFNHVYDESDFDEEVAEFVEEIATGPSVALRASKRLLRQGMEQSLDQAITNEAAAQVACFSTDDHVEGATAFMEKRSPEFTGE